MKTVNFKALASTRSLHTERVKIYRQRNTVVTFRNTVILTEGMLSKTEKKIIANKKCMILAFVS